MTLDEARLLANVNARAQSLFESGYRARWIDGPIRGNLLLEIRSPKGAAYRVDTQAATCDCPFFRGHAGRHPCKHLLGWERLLVSQRSCRLVVTLALLRVWADLDDGVPSRRLTERTTPDQETRSAVETEAAHAGS